MLRHDLTQEQHLSLDKLQRFVDSVEVTGAKVLRLKLPRRQTMTLFADLLEWDRSKQVYICGVPVTLVHDGGR